jgi:hypothetical protein
MYITVSQNNLPISYVISLRIEHEHSKWRNDMENNSHFNVNTFPVGRHLITKCCTGNRANVIDLQE